MTERDFAIWPLAFGGTTVQIEYTIGRSADIVEFLFKRIPRSANGGAARGALRLSEHPTDGVFTLSSEGEVCCVDSLAGAIASWLLHVTCLRLASGSAKGPLLHAAGVSWGRRGLLMPGASGSGKTTLTSFLIDRGFSYLTDELAYIPTASSLVEGFTTPLKFKKQGLDALKGHVSFSAGTPWSLEGPDDILVSPDRFPGEATAVPLSLIVFPRYRPRGRFRLEPLSPAQAGLRLMAGILNAAALPEHGFREAARLASLAPAYEMRYANLDQVEAHLELLRLMTVVRKP